MGKVYRLHTIGSNDLKGWDASDYNDDVIKSILDPQGATSEKPITSIPSPFAIIDLVKTAFNEVARGANEKGSDYLLWGADERHPKGTVYHQMVSDALDVAEIFFNYERFHDDDDPKKSLVEILEVKVKDLDGNSEPGATLKKYLAQDGIGADPYNFSKMTSIYMLRYTGPGALGMDVIGATSPATLFFAPSNPDVLKKVTSQFFFADGDQPFDEDLQPLHLRNKDFVKYLYALVSAKKLKGIMPELNAYLEECHKAAENELKMEINGAIAHADEVLNKYSQLGFVCNGENGTVEIIDGVPYHSLGKQTINSDFEIASTIYNAPKMPLVLPSAANSSQYESLYYVQGHWSSAAQVPDKDPQALDKRNLPGNGSRHPYLCKGDFLEDKIIKISYEGFDSDHFFCGGMTGNDDDFYLLPVKAELFRYFTPKEIQKKGIIKMKRLAGDCVEVELNIPIKGNGNIKSVSFPRNIYSQAETVNLSAAMAIEPFVRFKDAARADYRVALAYMSESKGCSLKFYEAGQGEIAADYYDRNVDDAIASCASYAISKSNFDFVKLEYNGVSAIVIPILPDQVEAGRKFKFAIDFGTTNTHVAYNVNGKPSQGETFKAAERELSLLICKPEDTLLYILRQEFVPEVIGENYKYPIRTILIWDLKWNWDNNHDITPGLEANSLLTFNRLSVNDQRNAIGNNLKWATDKSAQYRVGAYMQNLFLTLRNKVIAGQGDLDKTEVVWFYPASMTGNRYTLFKDEWDKAYKKYFGSNSANRVVGMTESQAPFEAIAGNLGTYSADATTIDIGGGTTDITLVNDGEVKCITSFRLAANSLFGRGNALANRPNGIVEYFKSEYETLLGSDDSLAEMQKILRNTEESEDLAAFFFSLPSSEEVVRAKLTGKANFVEKLKGDGDFKIIFMLFYVAIIWHIASLTKAKGLTLPSKIAFSGNGSRILPVVTTNESMLGALTLAIFKKVCAGSDVKIPTSVEILGLGSSQPKEQTCQGGLMATEVLDYVNANEKKTILLYADKTTNVNDDVTYSSICDADGKLFTEAVDAVAKDFCQMSESLAALSREMRFTDNFGISKSAIDLAIKKCSDRTMVESAIKDVVKGKFKNHETDVDKLIEETLFFFPLSTIFYDLAATINKQKTNQQ